MSLSGRRVAWADADDARVAYQDISIVDNFVMFSYNDSSVLECDRTLSGRCARYGQFNETLCECLIFDVVGEIPIPTSEFDRVDVSHLGINPPLLALSASVWD